MNISFETMNTQIGFLITWVVCYEVAGLIPLFHYHYLQCCNLRGPLTDRSNFRPDLIYIGLVFSEINSTIATQSGPCRVRNRLHQQSHQSALELGLSSFVGNSFSFSTFIIHAHEFPHLYWHLECRGCVCNCDEPTLS